MAQDFIELFSHLNTPEVYETTLYSLVEEAHDLIKAGINNSVPNTLRKFYESFLYRCEREMKGFNLKYHDEQNESHVNIWDSSKDLFKSDKEFYKDVKNFLTFMNNGSHFSDVKYGKLKRQDMHRCIGFIISLWNWYVQHVRHLDDSYLITSKYELPKKANDDYNIIKTKLDSKIIQVEKLKEENKELKEENAKLKNLEVEPETEIEEETFPEDIVQNEEEISINADEFEQDIYETIKKFNTEGLYCTHRTIALFLLGDRIAQTAFGNLSESELFAKYSKNKFTEFEYDMALQRLLSQEKIIQTDIYFNLYDKNANIFQKIYMKLKSRFGIKKLNKRDFEPKINQRYVKIIQKAIDEDKKIKLKYYKSRPNTNKKEVSIRVLKPVILLPKDKMNEVFDENELPKFTEDLYYLRATDDKDNALKTFRLDGIKHPKIIK